MNVSLETIAAGIATAFIAGSFCGMLTLEAVHLITGKERQYKKLVKESLEIMAAHYMSLAKATKAISSGDVLIAAKNNEIAKLKAELKDWQESHREQCKETARFFDRCKDLQKSISEQEVVRYAHGSETNKTINQLTLQRDRAQFMYNNLSSHVMSYRDVSAFSYAKQHQDEASAFKFCSDTKESRVRSIV